MSFGSTLRHEMTGPTRERTRSGPDGAAGIHHKPDFADVAGDNLDAVLRYLTHLVRNRDLAEDLTSATFERALRDWRRYDPSRARPSVWLVEIARRVALDHFRSEGRRRAREERYAATLPEAIPGVDETVGGLPGDLRAALGDLTRAERELIALRVVLDLDAAETARVVGSTRAAVGAGLHRALTKLRREVTR